MQPVRSILEQINPVNLGGGGIDFGAAFAQGRDEARRERELAMQEEAHKQALGDKQREADRVKEIIGAKAALGSVDRLTRLRGQVSPQVYERAQFVERAKLAQAGFDPQALMPSTWDDQSINAHAQKLRSTVTAASDPKLWMDYQRKAGDLMAADLGDPTLADPQFARQRPEWRRYLDDVLTKQPAALAKAGATNIAIDTKGNMPLEKPVRTNLQTQMADSTKTLASLDATLAGAKPEQFTYGAGAKQGMANVLGKINPDWVPADIAKQAGQRKVMRAGVDQLFNAYRKEITGAAAPMAELKMLRDTMVNPDLPWHEFRPMADQFRSTLTRTMRINAKLLREGVNVKDDAMAGRINDAWESGDQANSIDDIKARATELEQSRVAPGVMLDTLRHEGYLTQEQYDQKRQQLLDQAVGGG